MNIESGLLYLFDKHEFASILTKCSCPPANNRENSKPSKNNRMEEGNDISLCTIGESLAPNANNKTNKTLSERQLKG